MWIYLLWSFYLWFFGINSMKIYFLERHNTEQRGQNTFGDVSVNRLCAGLKASSFVRLAICFRNSPVKVLISNLITTLLKAFVLQLNDFGTPKVLKKRTNHKFHLLLYIQSNCKMSAIKHIQNVFATISQPIAIIFM